jgi:tetratricopeptide (TPR) repeat protein
MGRTFGQAFGELVRTKRGQEGLTQKELAIHAFDDESKVRRINDLETGAVDRPHAKTVDLLVVALNIGEEELAACRLNGRFTAREEAGIGLSRQLMENLAQRFDHENPDAQDVELFNYLKGKAEELKSLQSRLKGIEGLTKAIHSQIAAANVAIGAGEFDKADELLAAAEDIQQEERTLKEIETQSEIRFARGDAALFNGQRTTAAEHYYKAAEYFYGFDKRRVASILELSAGQIYEYERRTLSPNFEHAIFLIEKAIELTILKEHKADWVVAKYRLATLQQVQASALNDRSLYDAAIQTSKEAIEHADTDIKNDDYSNLQILLGNCYLARSESHRENAIDDLRAAVRTFEIAAQDARVDSAQFHSYLQSNLSAAYSRLSSLNDENSQGEFAEKAMRALRRAIELSAQEGQIDLWSACQYNLGAALAKSAQEMEVADPILTRFLRVQSISAFNSSLESYPETLLHPHTRRTQMSLGLVLLDQARFTTDRRRAIYLNRSIHAHEAVLAMSDVDDTYTSEAKFCIGLAFFLHAEIAEKKTAISDLEKALEYYEAALSDFQIGGQEAHLKKIKSARKETEARLRKLQTSQETPDTQSPSSGP